MSVYPITERHREALAQAQQQRTERRPQDSGLKNIADWRDALLDAATNLEHATPQQAAGNAAALRAAADDFLALYVKAQDLSILRNQIHLVLRPMIERREDVQLMRIVHSMDEWLEPMTVHVCEVCASIHTPCCAKCPCHRNCDCEVCAAPPTPTTVTALSVKCGRCNGRGGYTSVNRDHGEIDSFVCERCGGSGSVAPGPEQVDG